jgi:hypothetical protein
MSELDRELEISKTLSNMVVVGLMGTARLHPQGCPAITRRTPYHIGIHLGWARSPFVNKSCGCTILLNSFIKERDIRAVYAPPKSIQGRALAVQFRLGTQFALALVLYFPPKPASSKQSVYHKTINMMMRYAHAVCDKLGMATTIMFFCDLNDGIGLRKVGSNLALFGKLRYRRHRPREGKLRWFSASALFFL